MNRYDILLGKDATDSEPSIPELLLKRDLNEKIVVVEAGNMNSAFQLLGEALSRALVTEPIPDIPSFDLGATMERLRINVQESVYETIEQLRANVRESVYETLREHLIERVSQSEQRGRARKKRTEPWKHGRKKDPWER